MILAGDVGGTKTRLAQFEEDGGGLSPRDVRVFRSGGYGGLTEIVRAYLEETSARVERAVFGIAGPVKGGRGHLPNLNWVVDSTEIREEMALASVLLLNDLEANAYGIEVLGRDDFEILREGVPYEGGNAALVSAGTGLGEAGLHRVGDRFVPFATEGGHADFAPRNELEMELFRHLLERYDHVSVERVVSGPGLSAIYRFLRDTGRGEETPSVAGRLAGSDDPPAVISNAALGSEAGNFALKVLATGGIYLGGGIAPKILPKLREPGFLESLNAKGRLRDLISDIPVRIILNDKTALLGAGRFASIAGRPE
jgi:glucokinase